ncbi:MAG: regulatory protein RecX [Robiginitalea sp.]
MSGWKHKGYTVEEAHKRMQRFCTFRERCHQEVVLKLREMHMIPQAIDTIVVDLIEEGFLNEERFAKEFTRGKFRQKHWGKTRIRRALQQREISDYLIRKALDEIDQEAYLSSFDALAEKRWSELKTEKDLQRKRKKLVDYLLYRGWEAEMVYNKAFELGR